ncbi:glycoside hydrolase family 45 protein [Xylariaceae sp. AK1471]|nr:glycoside hydrolase family 45 protein [Xylariaceae sp. AK1471]
MYTKTALGLVSAASLAATAYGASGTGMTTRYWDCCKPSCAWSGKASVSAPVLTCDANDNPLTDPNTVSGCDGGSSFTCSNNSPWAVNDTLAYGFAATNIAGGSESTWCCACYQLKFTSGPVAGKTMIVQSTNTGGDLGSNQFDIMMPGGGVGIFNGCQVEFGQSLPGAQYGGVSSEADCSDPNMPEELRAGCEWRFDWFENADNPSVSFQQVACPAELTAVSGCTRDDDSSFPRPAVAGVAAEDVSVSVSQSSSVATSTSAASSSSHSVTSSQVILATSATAAAASSSASSFIATSVAEAASSPSLQPSKAGHAHAHCGHRRHIR